MVTKKEVGDGLKTLFDKGADVATHVGRKSGEAAETVTQLPQWATAEVSRKVAEAACSSLEIAVEKVKRRSLSRHPVNVSTTFALGPVEVVVSVQLEPAEQVEQIDEKIATETTE